MKRRFDTVFTSGASDTTFHAYFSFAVDASEFKEGTVEIDSALPVMKYEKVRYQPIRTRYMFRPANQTLLHVCTNQ